MANFWYAMNSICTQFECDKNALTELSTEQKQKYNYCNFFSLFILNTKERAREKEIYNNKIIIFLFAQWANTL